MGPGRPTCEVASLLILACGPERFDPKQKRSSRVKIRSIPIDPRVDPDGASPPATALPLLLPHEDSAPTAVTGGGGAACRRPAAGALGGGSVARGGGAMGRPRVQGSTTRAPP